jgi:uridine monophosphate synthetase
MRMTYSQRAEQSRNPLSKQLLQLIEHKRTNLALSADVTQCDQLLVIADKIGPEICVLKTHVDILSDFTPQFSIDLQQLAKKHQFLIFEDRKFADIGNTVKHQYRGGIYHIAEWADIINAHILPGPGIIQGLAEVGLPLQRGLLLLAEMSSSGNLLTHDYAMKTLAMAEQHKEFVIGFISQRKLSDDPNWIYMTPGVQLTASKDNLGQQYVTPANAIIENGTDIIIVGRGIISANDPVAEAKKYRQAGWDAYLKCCEV